MLNELNEYIKKNIKKNCLDVYYVNQIYKNNENNIEFDENIKRFVYEYLLYFDKNNYDDTNYKKYYSMLIKNKIEKYNKEYDILSIENIEKLINDYKFFNTALYLINNLDKNKLDKLSNVSLDKIIDNFSIDKKIEIKEFLDIFPNKLNDIINHFNKNNKLNDLLNILKYAKKVDKLDDDLAYKIDQSKYYGILLNKYKRNYQEKKQTYAMVEFITKSENYFNVFFPIFKNIVRKSNDKQDLKVIYTIIDIAKQKKYNINDNINIKQYKYTKDDLLIFNDVFGPHDNNCLSFTKDEINVIFVDNVNDLKLYGEKYFNNSKNEYIGFDSEWIEKINCKVKTQTAVVQLSDYEGKNILILDMVNLPKDSDFIQIFKDVFTNKKFIGYDLRDDLLNLPNEIEIHLQEKNELIDLRNIYTISTFGSIKSFSEICKEFFGKPLCKYEQCSNWENRPLRQSQLHYGALDAIYCCLLFKKLSEYKNK